MRRRDHHAYHDFSPAADSKKDVSTQDCSPLSHNNYDIFIPQVPEHQEIERRIASMRIQKQQSNGTSSKSQSARSSGKLIDQIPGPQLPLTLSINSNSHEPVPEIPEERLIAQRTVDQANEGLFRTFQDTCPPPADCQYEIVDQGVSGPNVFRTSMYNVPHTEKLRKMSQLPLSLMLRPFAEAEVPLADFSAFDGEEMPPRCRRCRAYMNPSMRFVQGGAKFVCNLCLFVNNTPAEYYQPVGPDGRRPDWEERPELAFGTYDFLVVPHKQAQPPQPPQPEVVNGSVVAASTAGSTAPDRGWQGSGQGYTPHPQTGDEYGIPVKSLYGDPAPTEFRRVFCCECSRETGQKRVLHVFADAVRACLDYFNENDRIAIMTFDSNINWFRPRSNGDIEMLVSSADGAVVPPDVFVNPVTQRDVLVKLLDKLPTYFEGSNDRNSCFGSAIESVLELPGSQFGGRVTAVFSSLPSVGRSKLVMRDPSIAGVTPPESPVQKQLFETTSGFYKGLRDRFRRNGWGCDTLAVPTTGFLDMTNLGLVAHGSGGRAFHYPRFVVERDARRLIADILSIATLPMQARNTSLRIRTSTGLQVENLYGAGYTHESNGTATVNGSGGGGGGGDSSDGGTGGFMDTESTVLATLKYDGQLDPKLDAHFQAAILYTAPSGEKRVRICNLLTGVTVKIKPVLKFVDPDVVMATIARQTLNQMGKHSIQELRHAVLQKIENIFGAARLHAGQGIPLTQLLMPTNLRQLMALGLALCKSIAIGSRPFSSDARTVNAIYLREATVNRLALALYPRIYDIGVLPEIGGSSPELMPMARARFSDLTLGSQAYIVCDGQQIYCWLSECVKPSVLQNLFGVSTLPEVSPWIDEFPETVDTDLNRQARQLCTDLARRVDRSWLPIQMVRQGLDGAEYQLRQLMAEDTINDMPSYINYVVRVHHLAKEYTEKEGWF